MITTCILARNAEAFIGRALACASRGGEIIVGNHSSSDSTVKIAESFGAKIVSFTDGPLDFSLARNTLAWESSNNLVLMLDADEFIDPNFYGFVNDFEPKMNAGVGILPLAESYAPGLCDPSLLSDQKHRVYDRRFAYWIGCIHERLIGPGWDNLYQIPFYLWHRAFKYSDEALWDKILFYNKTMGRVDARYSSKEYWLSEY
jgi:glycosyltransferase involved in cell wall biosynthesis